MTLQVLKLGAHFKNGNVVCHCSPGQIKPRITVRDCGPLFDILSGDDGLITISEFCRGIMQLKGTARSLDIVILQHENSKMMNECGLVAATPSLKQRELGGFVLKSSGREKKTALNKYLTPFFMVAQPHHEV